jgi:hypothetical protein
MVCAIHSVGKILGNIYLLHFILFSQNSSLVVCISVVKQYCFTYIFIGTELSYKQEKGSEWGNETFVNNISKRSALFDEK